MVDNVSQQFAAWQETLGCFEIPGTLIDLRPFGNGHLNKTLLGTWRTAERDSYFVHQCINHNIFKDIAGLMQNIVLCTEHLRNRLAAEGLNKYEALELVPLRAAAHEQQWHLKDASGGYWRSYRYVSGSRSFDLCESQAMARTAAYAFGDFNRLVADLDAKKLKATIPNFIDTPLRYRSLTESIGADPCGRAAAVQSELELVFAREDRAGLIMQGLNSGSVPWRVSHNDLKINNLLFDARTLEGRCVVDLDTVMPGSFLYDFGDLARTATSSAAEDEQDLSKVNFNCSFFEGLCAGFAGSFGRDLTAPEIELLPLAPGIITLHMGVRFLTDYINGDVYYGIKYPQHNLDRARTQFRLVQEMEKQEREMQALVRRYFLGPQALV